MKGLSRAAAILAMALGLADCGSSDTDTIEHSSRRLSS